MEELSKGGLGSDGRQIRARSTGRSRGGAATFPLPAAEPGENPLERFVFREHASHPFPDFAPARNVPLLCLRWTDKWQAMGLLLLALGPSCPPFVSEFVICASCGLRHSDFVIRSNATFPLTAAPPRINDSARSSLDAVPGEVAEWSKAALC